MTIVYYTTGISGTGRLVRGLAIARALERNGIDARFVFLHSSDQERLLAPYSQVKIPIEHESTLAPGAYEESTLYRTLVRLAPDILLVDLMWFTLHHFIASLPCKKVFLTRQTSPEFFSIPFKNHPLRFDSAPYDLLLATEPYPCPVNYHHLNPIVIRNREEILPAGEAALKLNLDPKKPHCLFSLNLEKVEFQRAAEKYARLEHEGYQIFYSSLFQGGVFPIVNFFNTFDFIVCGGGYNAFWETVFFQKKAEYIAVPTRFENQQWRIDRCRDYTFTQNGADELLGLLMNL
ncbi:MAG TPA: hypothetical protein ENN69_03390 [Spirochaetia bacterium]|nr:hypothetical protein [Spirochaetia bacterium]